MEFCGNADDLTCAASMRLVASEQGIGEERADSSHTGV